MTRLKSLTQPLFEETPVGPSVRIPIGATSAWLAVVETRAKLQCECAGQCGVAHTGGGWRAPRPPVRASAAPGPALRPPLA